jgi:hypothetical protein
VDEVTVSLHRESAKIYQFPTRVRQTAGCHREQADVVVDPKLPRVAAAAFGSGWYHEAAIEEAQRGLKR